MRAIGAEDRTLSAAFAAGDQAHGPLYQEANRGLSYPVFETTLAYILFRTWIARTGVTWEHRYATQKHERHADLVLCGRDGSPETVIEIKWWPGNQRKGLAGLEADLIDSVARSRVWLRAVDMTTPSGQ